MFDVDTYPGPQRALTPPQSKPTLPKSPPPAYASHASNRGLGWQRKLDSICEPEDTPSVRRRREADNRLVQQGEQRTKRLILFWLEHSLSQVGYGED